MLHRRGGWENPISGFGTMTVALLCLALGAIAFRAKQRQGYGPFLLSLAAATAVLLVKFVWKSKPTMYSTFGLLVVASLWNAWPGGVQLPKQQCATAANEKKSHELKFHEMLGEHHEHEKEN